MSYPIILDDHVIIALRNIAAMKKLNVPKSLIEEQEMIAWMSISEYQGYLNDIKKYEDSIDLAYSENNHIRQESIDEIYKRINELEYNYFCYVSDISLWNHIKLLDVISSDDYKFNLYKSTLEHCKLLYDKKYEEQYEKDLQEQQKEQKQ
jgi:hypothetical protein